MKTLKNAAKLSLIGLGLTTAQFAYAAGDGPTAGALGSGLNKTDVIVLSCPAGTASARIAVNDGIASGNELTVQMINPHGRAATQTVPDNGAFSDQATLVAGAGSYIATISKNTDAVEGYTRIVDCYDSNGNRLSGDQSALVQDQ